jgi:hypothetical protein
LDEQEKLSSNPTPGSPHPQCYPVELSYSPSNPEQDQSGTGLVGLEELTHGSPLHSRDHQAEDGSGSDGGPEPEERGEKRRYQDMSKETKSDTHHSEDSDRNRKTNEEDEGDEDDEDSRPAKRRKLRLGLPREALAPPSSDDTLEAIRGPRLIVGVRQGLNYT